MKAPSPKPTPTRKDSSTSDNAGPSASTADKADIVEPDAPRIDQPSRFDVLFGRGKPYQGHAGNIRLHKVVDLYKMRYSQARRHEKTEIAEEIVQFVKTGGAKGGRFLKRLENEEVWIEVSSSIARDKVSHALRGKPRKEAQDMKAFQSQGMLQELLSAKRAFGGAGFAGPMAKRQRMQPFSDLELMAAQQNSAFSSSARLPINGILGSPNGMACSAAMQQHLFANALAERQFASGRMGGMGLLSPPGGMMPGGMMSNSMMSNSMLSNGMMSNGMMSNGMMSGAPAPGEMNPLLLQQLAAERQLRAAQQDPRLWM